MKQLKITSQLITLSVLGLWGMGCQQIPSSKLSRVSNVQSQSTQKTPKIDYSNIFAKNNTVPSASANSSSTNTQTPQVASTNCARYTAPAEQVKSSCDTLLFSYQEDIAAAAPLCLSSETEMNPNSSCDSLVPQLNNMLTNCNGAFSILNSYASQIPGAAQCLSSIRALIDAGN